MNGEDVRRVIAQRSSLRETSRRVADQVSSADAMLAKYAETPPPTPNRRETGDALLEAARREAGQAAALAAAYADQIDVITRLERELRERHHAKALRTALTVAAVAVLVICVVLAALWWLAG